MVLLSFKTIPILLFLKVLFQILFLLFKNNELSLLEKSLDPILLLLLEFRDKIEIYEGDD